MGRVCWVGDSDVLEELREVTGRPKSKIISVSLRLLKHVLFDKRLALALVSHLAYADSKLSNELYELLRRIESNETSKT